MLQCRRSRPELFQKPCEYLPDEFDWHVASSDILNVAWLSFKNKHRIDRFKTGSNNVVIGDASVRSPRSAAIISDSALEWLTADCFFDRAQSGKYVACPLIAQNTPRHAAWCWFVGSKVCISVKPKCPTDRSVPYPSHHGHIVDLMKITHDTVKPLVTSLGPFSDRASKHVAYMK